MSLAELKAGYDLFKSAEDVDISLILQGKAMHGTNDAGLAKPIARMMPLAVIKG